MSDPSVPDVPTTARRSLWDRLSIVWLVPLLALGVALWVAWQSYSDQGPVIEIRFANAAGIAKEETEVRYRDVEVGVVEDVRFSADLQQVIVGVRLDKDVAEFVDEGASFWVVRPEVTAQGITGLDTVLSGVYIQGLWDNVPGEPAYEFEGLETAPLLQDREGLEITLRSTDGSLSGNTPIVFKGVEVGRVGTAMVSIDGFSVEARAVVYAPYDNLVTTSTRFWDTSGFSLSLGTAGASVDFDSLASLIAGGVTFDTFVSGSQLARDDEEFTVFDGAETARASVFSRNDGATLDLMAIFDGNVSGLTTGAPVELNGLRIGEVSALNGVVERTPSGSRRVRLQTILSIRPSRLGLEGETSVEDALAFLQGQVEDGIRVRLVTGSIFTGGLKLQLVAAAESGTGAIDMDAMPFPQIPVTAAEITDVATTAQGTLDRIDALPIEELMQSATDFLNASAVLIGSADTQAVPGEVAALLADVRGVVGSEAVQALPAQLGQLMADLDGSVASVQAILASVNEEQLVAEVATALQSVTQVTDEVEAALAEVPALLREITALAETAGTLDLETLVAEVTTLAANAGTLVGSEATQALPGEVAEAVAALQSVLSEAQGTVAALNEADGVARILAAVDSATEAADLVGASVEGLPALIDEISQVASVAADLPLDDLVTQVTDLATQAQVLIGAEATQALPGQIGAAVAELQQTLAEITTLTAELNASGGVERLLAAIDAAAAAAGSVSGSVEGVPALIDSLTAVANDAEALDLDVLLGEVTALVQSADALIAQDTTRALPGELNAALAELRLSLAAFNDGDAIANTNAALLAARRAADEIAAAAAALPPLMRQTTALLAQADATLAGFEETSPAIRDARAALRQISAAAEAVSSLARAIERNPNSLISGR